MNVTQLNYHYDDDLTHPEVLLERYRTLTDWSTALAEAGANRVVVVQRFHRDADLVRDGIEYMFRAARGPGRVGQRLRSGALNRAVARTRPDVVHINGLESWFETWRLRRMLPPNAAIVVQDHAGVSPDITSHTATDVISRVIRRVAMQAPDGFLFSAAEQATPWRQAGLIAARQPVYEVMEASTRLRAMPRARARQLSGVDGSPALLWVGRLTASKDPMTVLEGFEQSLAHLPAAALTMVYEADDLRAQVLARLDRSPLLSQRVRLIGTVPHDVMPAYYSAADIFVSGSRREGSGYALLEACACGLVPVVTDIPSFRVITSGGSLGALWDPGNAGGLARSLCDVASRDLTLLRSRVAEHFERSLSWHAVGRQAMAAYRDVKIKRGRA